MILETRLNSATGGANKVRRIFSFWSFSSLFSLGLILLFFNSGPATAQSILSCNNLLCPGCLLGTHKLYSVSNHSSMYPTIDRGSCIFVRKVDGSEVDRGDIVAFRMKDGSELVKRVIGVDGDTIEYRNGQLIFNGQIAEREYIETRTAKINRENTTRYKIYRENLAAFGGHLIAEISDEHFFDEAGPFIIPRQTFFVVGDNRDNSADSRTKSLGFVQFADIVGVVVRIDN